MKPLHSNNNILNRQSPSPLNKTGKNTLINNDSNIFSNNQSAQNDSFVSTNSTRSRNRMRQRSISKGKNRARDNSAKLKFTPQTKSKIFSHQKKVESGQRKLSEFVPSHGVHNDKQQDVSGFKEKKSIPPPIKMKRNNQMSQLEHHTHMFQEEDDDDELMDYSINIKRSPVLKKTSSNSVSKKNPHEEVVVREYESEIQSGSSYKRARNITKSLKNEKKIKSKNKINIFKNDENNKIPSQNEIYTSPKHPQNHQKFSKKQSSNEFFEIFQNKIKEVNSITPAQKNQRLISHPSTNKIEDPPIKKNQRHISHPSTNKIEDSPITPIYKQRSKDSQITPIHKQRSKDSIPYTNNNIKHQQENFTHRDMSSKSIENVVLPRMKNNLEELRKAQSLGESDEIMQLMRLDNRGKIELNEKALKYIKNIQNKLKVVSVIGPYRTGKSFLLNRLNNQQKGFHLGNTTNPCTQGVWLWAIKDGSDQDGTSTLLLDTEGLFAYNRNEVVDSKLFLFSACVSSLLIYNTMGVINESAIEKFGFIAELGKHLKLEQMTESSKLSESQIKEEMKQIPSLNTEISKMFPHLIWLLRDFTLDIHGENNYSSFDDYLEQALLQKDHWDKNSSQTLTRKVFKQVFTKRNCFTLVRPLHDEQQLRNIEQVPFESLRPEFTTKLHDIIDFIDRKTTIKTVKGNQLNGDEFCLFLKHIVASLNNDSFPRTFSIEERLLDLDKKKTMKNSVKQFKSELDVLMKELPVEEHTLSSRLENIKLTCLSQANTKWIKGNVWLKFTEEYLKKIKPMEDQLYDSNITLSKTHNKNTAENLLEDFQKNILNVNLTKLEDVSIVIEHPNQQLNESNEDVNEIMQYQSQMSIKRKNTHGSRPTTNRAQNQMVILNK